MDTPKKPPTVKFPDEWKNVTLMPPKLTDKVPGEGPDGRTWGEIDEWLRAHGHGGLVENWGRLQRGELPMPPKTGWRK